MSQAEMKSSRCMTLDEAREVVASAFASGVEAPGVNLDTGKRLIVCSVDDPIAIAAYNNLRDARIRAPQMMQLALDEHFDAHPLEGEMVSVRAEEETDGADRHPEWPVDKDGLRLDLGKPMRPSLRRLLARANEGRPHRLRSLSPPGGELSDWTGRVAVNAVELGWGASFECSDGETRGAMLFTEADVRDPWLRELAAADRAQLLAALGGKREART